MKKIKILTDSCSDLSGELLEKYDIDYGRMNIVHNGEEKLATLTWDEYSPKQLYDIMRNGERITTTQVPAQEFMRIFRKYLDEGCDIIYIGCSSKQSGSVNTGIVVSKELLKEYPGSRISCIDSLNASVGEGMLAIHAAELLAAGKSFDEIVAGIKAVRKRVNQFVTVHSLDALKRAGRVKASSAFLGNLMGVKPIIVSDVNGDQTPIKKVRGRANSFEEIVSLLKDAMENPSEETVYVAHADCNPEELEMIKNLISQKIGCKEIRMVYIGPIIGASIGPDAIGIWGFGKEVTYKVGEAK
ncbi:MAG: DegV family protein [Treponema sp.]|nr:DegV family protein [Treponema sp.]